MFEASSLALVHDMDHSVLPTPGVVSGQLEVDWSIRVPLADQYTAYRR